jgi:hypothetical protein
MMAQTLAQTLAQTWSFAARWYSIPLLLLVWQLAVGSGLVESRLLPSPMRVWDALVTDLGDGTLAYHAGVTLYRALTGFALAAVIIGVPFAAAMARSALIRNLFEPIFFFGWPRADRAVSGIHLYLRRRHALEDRVHVPRVSLSDRGDLLLGFRGVQTG